MAQSTVEMKDDAFDPIRRAVERETTVVWRNTGSANHVVDSVQFHGAAKEWQFRTRPLRPGDSAVYAFDEPGIYEYHCGLQGTETCGVILLGDVSLSESLPCEDP